MSTDTHLKTEQAASDGCLAGEFGREHDVQVNETDFILEAIELIGGVPQKMIDVGAHQGGSMREFLAKGWRVFAFEPDRNNMAILRKCMAQYIVKGKLSIDRRAVADNILAGVPFYRSDESSGISALAKFASSHIFGSSVNVTTLSDFALEISFHPIGFLKIDTEGHDLFVLRGYPWSLDKPSFVMAEFEDEKTIKLGYTTKQMQDFLIAQGYEVYISEWHPIIRYGISHQWRGFWHSSHCKIAPGGWGNIIAIRKDLDSSPLCNAFQKFAESKKDIPMSGNEVE